MATMFQGKLWNFRNMMRSSMPIKRISWIFDIGDLRSGHFCDIMSHYVPLCPRHATPHYVNGQKINSVIFTLTQAYLSGIISRIGELWTIRVKICIAYPSKGHLRSSEVTNRHMPITFDQKELETWNWCQYVRLGQANRLIDNMTHFGHHVTLAWLDLRSNFDLDLSKLFYIWFDAP